MNANIFQIKKVITGHAYARNGNVHNATPIVRFDTYRDNVLIGSDRKLSDAKKFISDIKNNVF